MTESASQVPHEPHYDVRAASQVHSNIAAVLAGFAFAAVILVMQMQNLPPSAFNASLVRDWATIAFLVAFFGCVVAAFTFAAVAGEEVLAPRSYSMAFLGGSGFSISAVYVFWGLASLTKIFLSSNVSELSRWIFYFVILIAPFYLVLTAIDPVLSFDRKPAEIKLILGLAIPSYLLILPSILLSLFKGVTTASRLSSAFGLVIFLSLVGIAVDGVWSLVVSEQKLTYRVTEKTCGIWIFIHSIIFSLLVLLV